MTGMGRITLRRVGRRFDLLRRYRIFLDGVEVGKLRVGGTISVERPPGHVLIEARIDWCSALPLIVPVVAGEETVVEVANSHGLAGAMAELETLEPETYLKLTRVSGAEHAPGPWG
jgi:hypothetical protein